MRKPQLVYVLMRDKYEFSYAVAVYENRSEADEDCARYPNQHIEEVSYWCATKSVNSA